MAEVKPEDISYRHYKPTEPVETLQKLIEVELSEPYSIYLYRHFAVDYPELTFVAEHNGQIVGCIMGKFHDKADKDATGKKPEGEPVQTEENAIITGRYGYIAMLAVLPAYRKKNIGKRLVKLFIEECRQNNCDYVKLETEVVNIGALRLYESCGFIKKKHYRKYYQNGNDAYGLRYYLKSLVLAE